RDTCVAIPVLHRQMQASIFARKRSVQRHEQSGTQKKAKYDTAFGGEPDKPVATLLVTPCHLGTNVQYTLLIHQLLFWATIVFASSYQGAGDSFGCAST